MNIYDIAERAGVSIATVSRVLNGGRSVSLRTRERVLAVMEEMGYVPNVFARGLGLGSIRQIGVLCTDVADPYYAAAVSSVESALQAAGYDAVLCCTGSRLEDKKAHIVRMLARKVDGLILIGSIFSERADNSHIRQAADQIPVVVVNGLVELQNVYCVLCDERAAMRENVEALAKKGFRQPLYLYDVETYSGMQKLAGYREGLSITGGPAADRLVRRVQKSGSLVRSVCSALADAPPFDAVLASEDLLAAAALKSICRPVPVVGFNNSALCHYTTPTLTSVDNVVRDLCATAVRLLGDVFAGKTAPNRTLLPHRLVVRESFRPE